MKRFKTYAMGLWLGLSACVGGQVTDRESGAALNGVTVRARSCPSCTQVTTHTARRVVNGDPESLMDGVFEFNPYEDGPNVHPRNGFFASELVFERSGYNRLVKYITPRISSVRHASGEDRYASVLRIKLTRGPAADRDADGLTDVEEAELGTDPDHKDTDRDGVWDGWEVHGHDWVDYAGMGAHPLRKDVFVEIDYEHYHDGTRNRSARLSDAVIRKMEQIYLGLDVTNPDGTRGIRLHVFQQGHLPRGHRCDNANNSQMFHEKHRRVFKYGQLCLTPSPNDQMGQAVVGGSRFFGRAVEIDQDPGNDASEEQQGVWLGIVAHELGHTLGLRHGGEADINCKPNYPSLMNYVYTKNFLGRGMTVSSTAMRFSDGRLPALDERAMSERNPFPGFSAGDIAFLRYFGWGGDFGFPVHASNTWVDWDRNGSYDVGTRSIDVNGRGYVSLIFGTEACAPGAGLSVLTDHNDGQRIDDHLLAQSNRTVSGTWPITSAAEIVCRF